MSEMLLLNDELDIITLEIELDTENNDACVVSNVLERLIKLLLILKHRVDRFVQQDET